MSEGIDHKEVEKSVSRLREIALEFPRPGYEWEDRPRFYPPASNEYVTEFERAAGFALPADVLSFLAITGEVVGMSVHNGYWVGGVEQLAESDLPRSVAGEPAMPVATDGGGNAFLLASDGRIWRWDHESEEVSVVATSFALFLKQIADDWTAFVEETPNWQFLV